MSKDRRKLTADQIKEIKNLLENGVKQKDNCKTI